MNGRLTSPPSDCDFGNRPLARTIHDDHRNECWYLPGVIPTARTGRRILADRPGSLVSDTDLPVERSDEFVVAEADMPDQHE